MNKEIEAEENNLEYYWNRLDQIERYAADENAITIRNIIKSNLPKDILCKEENNELQLYIRKIIPPKRKEEEIRLGAVYINNYDTEKIEINVNITIDGNYREEDFSISKANPLRIYKIISYIHDNLSYDE